MAGIAPQIPGCRDLSLIGERVARSLFSATSDRLGRPVTVIAYPPLSEGRTEADFDRAAATAQRLGVHPSMISIHEWGHADDHRPWIITDPQPAEALDTLLKLDVPLEIERALQMGVLLAGALETAHAAGIIHGDLSPARVVVGPHGEPLMTETGLARFAVFPGLGALNNPVRYHASPEVLEGTDLSPATDVYSLATTVYALIAGRAPQEKPAEVTDSNASLLLRVLQMAPPPIERPDLPPGMLEALRGPLAPDPRKRPQQAIEVAWLLQDVQRRAGFAITEPVVLDLDDIEHHRSRRAGSYPAPAKALPPARTPAPEPVADPAPPAPTWGTWSGPIDVEGPAAAAGAQAPAGPRWSPPPIPDVPTGLPLLPAQEAEELAMGNESEAPPAGGTLWPSSWPAGEPEADLPAWARQPASPPANGATPPAAPASPAPADTPTDDLAASAQPANPTPTNEGPADPPPWAQHSAPAPGATHEGAADLPRRARPAAPARGATHEGPADLPPWAQPSAPARGARNEGPADLPWVQPTKPTPSAGPADLPRRARPAVPAPGATDESAGDLPPWAQPGAPTRGATNEGPADLPAWAQPSAPAAGATHEGPADLPWVQPTKPTPPNEGPADLPWMRSTRPTPASEGPADLPAWAQPSAPAPGATNEGPAGLPPWAQPAEPPKPTNEGPADLPAWAQPAKPPTPANEGPGDVPWSQPSKPTPTSDRPADLPGWAQAAGPPTPTSDRPADLPGWAQAAGPPKPTNEGPADLPWAQPTGSPSATPERAAALPWSLPTEPPTRAHESAADRAPTAQPTETSRANQGPADLPPSGQLIEPPKPAGEGPADLPPWAQPSAPTPGATADRPSLPKRREQADETSSSAQPPSLPRRREQGDEKPPAWAQFPPPPDWLKGGAARPEEKAGDPGPGAQAGNTAGLPGWARAKPGDGSGADEGEPPWLPGAETNSSFAVARPPELDILPAWYTDPLPLGSNGSSNGRVGAGPNERLPGAGDELRSLFGAVVGEPPALPPLPPEPEAFSAGPLGPPTPRPPLDMRKLEDPFGPSAPPPPPPPPPAAKAAPVRATGGIEKPLRLPRPPVEPEPPRVPSGSTPGRQAYSSPDQARSNRTTPRPPREERSEPAAPAAPAAPQPERATGGSPPAGPPALPVIVLIVVLAVLVLGILWLVITGDDSGTPADEPAPEAVVVAPTGLTVTPTPGGDQLAWQGDAGDSYIVTVLSPTEPPQALPAAPGLSALVPSAGASAPGQRCYTVAVAPSEAGGQPGPASDPACPPGVSPASMMPAA